MKFLDLSTDVLAVKCVNNYIFIGIGCFLYVVDKTDHKIKIKINALHPDNIHGIVFKSNNKVIVYGGKSLCIFQYEIQNDCLSIEKIDEVHRFSDWIISTEWLGSTNDSKLAILFAHNNVYNYDFCKKQYSKTSCKEACLLYTGTIAGQNYENAIVFSGTVFQEILIWKANSENNKYSDVLHRLKGHKGVLFSVLYDPVHNIICSTSDDRTVRLWKISNEIIENQAIINWEDVKISLQTTMYGHLARVWKVVLLKNILASIGEDSRICFWDLSGNLLHKIEAHQGAPIWCIDMSEDEIIYTGGADGSVNSWPLSRVFDHVQNNFLIEKNKDTVPKYVTFVDNGDVLIYANLKSDSQLLHFSQNKYQFLNLYDLPEFSSSYCIMELSLDRQCLALASIKGNVTLYTCIEDVWKKKCSYKVTDSKIFSLQWLNADRVLVSLANGILYVVEFLMDGAKILSEHVLPSSRERWVTSACEYNNILICGDRMGSIFVYKKSCPINGARLEQKDPVQTFKKIHGRLGVQSCTIVNSSLISTGRDGTLRFYRLIDIDSVNPTVEFLYAKSMPMDWVSKLLISQKDYHVLGFKEDDFVIYNVKLNRVLAKISCGGGHRSWDCMMSDKFIKFVYIQKRQIHAVTVPLNTLFIPPLMTGFHTKEIYCMKVLPILPNKTNILISGGEDCTFHVNYVNCNTSETDLNLKNINILDGHLSSIRCISILHLTTDESFSKHLIFSGGGRAQLKVWEVTVKFHKTNFSSKDVSCRDLLSYMLHGPDKERNKIWIGKELMYNADPETRFMDVSTMKDPQDDNNVFLFVAGSDGYLRTLIYDIDLNKLTLIDTLAHKNRCILKVHSFIHKDKIIIMTLATDGQLNFWNFLISNKKVEIQKIFINETEGFSLHQSGINSFDMKLINSHEYLLATGGDDNLLSLIVFKIALHQNIPCIQIVSSWNTALVHYAQITGVKLLNNEKLYSIGADQKLAIHKYSHDKSKIDAELLEEKTLCIPDIQGITFCESQKPNTNLFCIFGKGFQLLEK